MDTQAHLRGLLRKLPAQSPPAGVTPNFVNPPGIWGLSAGILIFGIIVATFMVGIKMYAQIRIVRKFFLEDWFLLLAWASFVGALAPLCFLIGKLPIGIHQWNTTLGKFFDHLFYWYCALIIYAVVVLLLKITVLLQILRVFAPSGLRTHTFWIGHGMLWFNIIFYLTYIFLEMFSCNPRQKFWDKTLPGHCIDFLASHVAANAICLFSDIAILLLPQRVIFSLNLPMKRKIGLSLVFAVGIFACAASIARIYYHILLFKTRADYTYTLGTIAVWSLWQVNAGFIIIGLPVIPQVFGHVSNKSWAVKLRSGISNSIGTTTKRSIQSSARVATIGGGDARHKGSKKGRMASDADFDELVLQTDKGSYADTEGSMTG